MVTSRSLLVLAGLVSLLLLASPENITAVVLAILANLTSDVLSQILDD